MVARALYVLVEPGAEIEAQLDQVGDVVGFGVGSGGSCIHNGLEMPRG